MQIVFGSALYIAIVSSWCFLAFCLFGSMCTLIRGVHHGGRMKGDIFSTGVVVYSGKFLARLSRLEIWHVCCWRLSQVAFSTQGEIGWLLGRVCILVRLCKTFLFSRRSGGGSCVSYWRADVGAVRKLPMMAFITSRWGQLAY